MSLPKFTMRFEPMTIDHLGLRLYSTLPPVISELVSNSYDAESKKVEVTIPDGSITPDSEVIVRDYGHGMSAAELAEEYLPIGRSRRGEDDKNVMSKNGTRRVTGRKGLGKLSALGVATEMDVRSIHDGEAVCLRINYDRIKEWVRTKPSKDFEPEVVQDRCGPTKEKTGVSITLRKFHRTRAINPNMVRQGLARRLSFIGSSFQVFVNPEPIGPGDRINRDMCAEGFSWSVEVIPGGGKVSDENDVTGWLGFLVDSSQTERGVDIFAVGKAVELGSFFRFASTHAQFARAHLVGEINADFLDADKDLVATARNSVVWESEVGLALEQWGQAALKWAFDRWVELRRNQKDEEVIKAANFDTWLATRQPSEQRVAKRLVKLLVDDVTLEPSSAKPMLEIVKSSVETIAFHELVDAIETEGISVQTLLKLFDEWRVIEAREHLRLADGRLAAIEQLEYFKNAGALEVQELQPLFDKHPWLIDHAWKQADRQATYTKLAQKHCKEPRELDEADRRLDIFVIRSSGGAVIVELKRPEKKLSRQDLEQIEAYTDWARDNIVGTGADALKYVHGLLLVGELNEKLKDKMQRLAGDDIRVETYEDLHARSKEYYAAVEKALSETAPEYVRSRRKKGKK